MLLAMKEDLQELAWGALVLTGYGVVLLFLIAISSFIFISLLRFIFG